jgi:hypothetical protein
MRLQQLRGRGREAGRLCLWPPEPVENQDNIAAARLADARGSEVHHDGQESVVYLGAAGPWRSGAGNIIAGRAVHQPLNSHQSLASARQGDGARLADMNPAAASTASRNDDPGRDSTAGASTLTTVDPDLDSPPDQR